MTLDELNELSRVLQCRVDSLRVGIKAARMSLANGITPNMDFGQDIVDVYKTIRDIMNLIEIEAQNASIGG